MKTGTVKSFNHKRGYGFIITEDESEIFVHQTGICMSGFRKLIEGQTVEYETAEHEGRTKAVNVTVIK
ncbi:cold-shock protein [Enterococcus faecalis]|uniref:cold-shock protein n=1 Tax=Enterococcus faecalis TaxID=1351 RepID=UPI000353F9BC|nr:cold shock domain-containing protein [Enterococcus faecalis]EPI38714.1 putative cold shock protein CspA [Enterococcus faecalis LA3B-2]